MPKPGKSDAGVKRAPATRVTPARADGRLIAVDKEVGAPFVNEAVLAASGDGLVLFSADDRVTYLNPAASKMLGVSRAKLLGSQISVDALVGIEPISTAETRHCCDVMHCNMPDCPAYHSEELRCWLVNGTLCCGGHAANFAEKRERCSTCEMHKSNADVFDPLYVDEYHELEFDDPKRIVKARVSPVIDAEGDYIGRVLAMHDVTREREIDQMKNEFVSTVSHELRTPLTSIKGYVDLILDGDAGEINEIQEEFLGIVKENSDRLVDMINDMLDISRIESGRIRLKVEPVNLADSIEGAVDSFRAVLNQTGRAIKTRVPENLPLVAVDRDRVGQVLINLISNALKYSPAGGDVTISAKHTDGLVQVSVADKGMGISREDQKKLFTKFYRVDSAMTREIGGTGLGLSITKSIIELLGGTVSVRSKLGEGSTFTFTVPVAAEDLVRTPSLLGPEQIGGTVLVVDQDTAAADLIATYLVKRGYEVVKAHTADEALALALRIRPRVITLDVILEGTDGFELLQSLKDHVETAKIPIVVVSIICDEGRSCRLGASEYLEKPIDQQRLIEIIDPLVGSVASPVALVVDDDQSIVRVLTQSLRRRGFTVAAAYDGEEAIAAIEQHKPDVIITDLRMPRMDGYELIRQVKTCEAWRDIPIVIMTAHRIDRDRIDILNLAQGRLSKPFSPELIADQVEALLDREYKVESAS
jgi:signal transduction histidine kinase/CheY-like chemotaxis protein